MLRLHRMKVKGFFSYQEPVEVDFARLMEAGFFGILGATGAGKSALLDCLLIALFGKSARTERSPSSLLNRHAKEAYIYLEFFLGAKKYLIKYHWRGSSPIVHTLSELGKDGPFQLAPTEKCDVPQKVKELLGLNYEHFTQTFLLEQGRFQQFLYSTPAERAKILTSVLRLDPLDLQPVIDRLKAEAEVQKKQLEQQKTQLEQQADPQRVINIENEKQEIQQKKQQIDNEIDSLNRELEEMAVKEKEWQELTEVRQRLEMRQARRAEFEGRKERLQEVQKVHGEIARLFDREKEYQEQVHERRTRVQALKAQFESSQSESQSLFDEVERLKPLYEKKSEYERVRDRLKNLRIYKDIEKELHKFNDDTQNKQKEINVIHQNLNKLKQEEIELKKQLEQVEDELRQLSTNLLTTCKEWENQKKVVEQTQSQYERCKQELESQRGRLEESFRPLVKFCNEAGVTVPDRTASSHEWKQTFKALENALNNILEEERARFDRATWAYQLATTLLPGHPCPVCGSRHHPAPASTPPPDAPREQELKKAIDSLRQIEREYLYPLLSLESNYQNIQNNLSDNQEKLSKIQEELQKELKETSRYSLRSGLYTDLERDRQKLEETRTNLSQNLENNQMEQRNTERKIQEASNEINSLNQRAAQLRGRMETLASELPEGGLAWSDEEIQKQQEQNQKILDQIGRYPKLKEEADKKRKELDELKNRLAVEEKSLQDYQGRLSEVTQQLEQEVKKKGLDLARARQLYGLQIDWQKESKEVTEFFSDLKNLQDREKELALKASDYNPTLHQQKKHRQQDLQRQKELIANQEGKLEQQLKQVLQAQEELKKVCQNLKRAETYHEQLAELSSLFRGKAFMQFVARRYLMRILETANAYLRQWNGGLWELRLPSEGADQSKDQATQSSASPRVSSKEKQESVELRVEVVDYMGPKTVVRSVKTLSGGQTFQASLALALALSKRVASRPDHGAQPSFLLIDEGFGSLDPEALDQVVSTLYQLARDNQAIGVITHREELKEHLQAYLLVEMQDTGRGSKTSRITPSWKV